MDQDVDNCKALRTVCSERERKRGPNKKKIRELIKRFKIRSASPLTQGTSNASLRHCLPHPLMSS